MTDPASRGIFTAALAVTVVVAGSYLYKSARTDPISVEEKNEETRAAAASETWESHVQKHGPLVQVWPDTLYVLEASGCGNGPPVRNMILYKTPQDDRLVIYNGIAVNEATMTQIQGLGTPSVLVVPNQYHRCCAAIWKARFPDMLVVCPAVAQDAVNQVVQVNFTMEEWAEQEEWSKWIHTRTINGWGGYETLMEVALTKSDSPEQKKALVVCDTLFAMPYKPNEGRMERMINGLFDCQVEIPKDKNTVIIPKVARISRIFAIKDWAKAEEWFRTYAREHGPAIGAIMVGHGLPIVQVDPKEGCTRALEGVADQLTKARW